MQHRLSLLRTNGIPCGLGNTVSCAPPSAIKHKHCIICEIYLLQQNEKNKTKYNTVGTVQ